MIDIRSYEVESDEYLQELSLRDLVLRQPLGLKLSDIDTLGDSEQIHYGAFDRDLLVGCVQLKLDPKNNAQITQMAVRSSHRKLGIGRSLVRQAESRCWAEKYNLIRLNARAYAMGFYEKLGYKICSEKFMLVGIPHFQMEKSR